jgi:hypothetical protein
VKVTFKAAALFEARPGKRAPARAKVTPPAPPAPAGPLPASVGPPLASRLARQLALAYHVERLIEAGVLRDYAQAARLLGVSRARLTQIVDLLGLPTAVQEGILAENVGGSERALRSRVSSSG